jgi:hypothetical protein
VLAAFTPFKSLLWTFNDPTGPTFFLGRFLLSLGYPACGFSSLLSQEHTQLCAMFLYMTQIVQLKLRKRQLSPSEPAQPVGLFV